MKRKKDTQLQLKLSLKIWVTKVQTMGCAECACLTPVFGLLEKPEDGKLAVSKDVENYQYAPTKDQK